MTDGAAVRATAEPEDGAATLPGWYGKLASLGDFAHRRLPAPVVQCIDAWLSDGMAASRRNLGDAWLDAYLAAPVIRTAWTPGVVDAHWWFGVLMPSCDKVGRYFPLVVAWPAVTAPRQPAALDRLHARLGACDRAATATLDEGATVQTFEAALLAAVTAPLTPGERQPGALPMPPHPRTGTSVWWHEADVCVAGAVATAHECRGLPSAEDFAALLTGQSPYGREDVQPR